MGGRQTQPVNPALFGLWAFQFIPRRNWQDLDLNDITLNKMLTAQQVLELLADLSPEVSNALWNYQRLANTEWTFEVRTLDEQDELPEAQGLVTQLINRLNENSGGLNNIVNQFILSACTQGAICAELALTEDLEDVDDLYPINPYTIYFQREGQSQKLVPFQKQVLTYAGMGENFGGVGIGGFPFKRLNELTFCYIPVDPGIDDPYGRPPFAPVLQLVVFYMQLLHDLRQSVHVAAWGRVHIKVVEEVIMKFAPASIKSDPTGQKQRQFVKTQIQQITEAYNTLRPDDAFVSTDNIQLDALDFSGGTLQVDNILRAIERLMFRALKQLPVLMGSNEGTTETHGTVQMDIYASAIRNFQKLSNSALEKLFNVALRVWGISGVVKGRFKEFSGASELQLAQAAAAQIANAAQKRDQGWITNDDASMEITGSAAVADPYRAPTPSLNANFMGLNPDKKKDDADTSGGEVKAKDEADAQEAQQQQETEDAKKGGN
jgi:hypothetical protein